MWPFKKKEEEVVVSSDPRMSLEEILDRRNKVHSHLLDMERQEKEDPTRQRAWVEALDWVLGVK